MPFNATRRIGNCTVCGAPANILQQSFGVGELVDCSRCGDFQISHVTATDVGLPFSEPKDRALASYTIRKMQKHGALRPQLLKEFFSTLRTHSLPSPTDVMDNLLCCWRSKLIGVRAKNYQ